MHVFFVFISEMFAKLNEHLIGYWADVPCVGGEHTSVFE